MVLRLQSSVKDKVSPDCRSSMGHIHDRTSKFQNRPDYIPANGPRDSYSNGRAYEWWLPATADMFWRCDLPTVLLFSEGYPIRNDACVT